MNLSEILIIDDETINLTVLRKVLSPHFHIKACKSGEEALKLLEKEQIPDLILLDIVMPGMDGYEVLARIKGDLRLQMIPVIYISALDNLIDEEKGFRLGAVDYIVKPFRPAIVLERVKVHLELKMARDRLRRENQWLEEEVERRVQENQKIQDATLSVITQLVETRDSDTAKHIDRTKAYVAELCEWLYERGQMPAEYTKSDLNKVIKAAPLHDLGKIGIPDSILLKPDKLTAEEFEIMKQHCRIGADAIRNAINSVKLMGGADSEDQPLSFLKEAELIALTHHEKWDGSGYPQGLKGEEIPQTGRIMALADVFDALTTKRVYKTSWTMESATEYILSQREKHFAPEVVDAFIASSEVFRKIMLEMSDSSQGDENHGE